jgi:hypothetical protein
MICYEVCPFSGVTVCSFHEGLSVIAGTAMVVKDSHQLDARAVSAGFPEEINFSFPSS